MNKDVKSINIADIRVNPNQPRVQFDEKSITELAESISENGLIQPIIVREVNDGYELVAGERRLRATMHLKKQYIDAIINNYDEETSARVAIIENIQREDLTAIEEAVAYEKLLDEHGYTQQELANSLGKSQSTIANKIRLLGLSEKVKNSILERKITERHGRALLKIGDQNKQEQVLEKIIDSGFNVEQSEEYIKNIANPKVKPMRKKIISKIDYRIEINTIKQSLDMIAKTGVMVDYDIDQNDEGVSITIKLKK